jgi:hypothetical protein
VSWDFRWSRATALPVKAFGVADGGLCKPVARARMLHSNVVRETGVLVVAALI